MRGYFLKIILVLLLAQFGALQAFAGDLSEDWYNNTALVGGAECPAAPTLYRAVRDGYFPLSRVVRNMVGDELAEHPSWRFSALLRNTVSGDPTEEDWIKAKNTAEKELKAETNSEGKICGFGDQFAHLTVLGGSQESKDQSYGIATSNDFLYARNYTEGQDNATLLRIDEVVPRAAKAIFFSEVTRGEYYIPIVIPARDISGAWSGNAFIEKKTDSKGELQEIDIHKVSTPFDSDVGKLIARIVPCSSSESCQSDKRLSKSHDLAQIQAALTDEASLGRRFKMVSPSDSGSPCSSTADGPMLDAEAHLKWAKDVARHAHEPRKAQRPQSKLPTT